MAFGHVVSATPVSGTNGGTTSSVDTSGASLLTMATSYYSGHGSLTVSDSKGNTWTALTERTGAGGVMQRTYYAINPIVGSGHTFTFSGSIALSTMIAQAWSGADTSSPFDQEAYQQANPSSSLQTGSLTPTVDGCLLLAVGSIGASDTTPSSWNSPFTGAVFGDATGSYFGTLTAYEIQTTKTARNPTFAGNSNTRIASLNVFKPAGGGGGGSNVSPLFNGLRLVNGVLVNGGLAL